MLTDAQIRKTKPAEKAFKLPDGGGLHILITPAGGKLWRYRYEVPHPETGKRVERLLSIGPYPDVSLAEAREARTKARTALREGRDPSILKKQNRLLTKAEAAMTFEAIAREWHELQKSTWTETHGNDILRSLERDIFPSLGSMPIRDITVPLVLAALRNVEGRKTNPIETARRIRQRMSAVFCFAIASGRADADPANIVRGAMSPLVKGRQPAITDLDEVRKVLRAGESVPAHPVTKIALRVLALTSIRPGELRNARWEEFPDLDAAEPQWIIPAERMKMKVEHVVPLSTQTVEALKALKRMTGRGPVVFPMIRNAHKPISENTIGYLLNRAGYHQRHVPHGWRAAFSTIMNDRFPHDQAIIDLMLAHQPTNKVERAYNRAEHQQRRRELAQIWADLLMVDQAPLSEIFSGVRHP